MKRKSFILDGVEAEKAEAIRRYNNRKTFRNILRAIAVASFIYLWFPTVANSILIAGVWFYKTGAVILTNRNVVFVFVNLLIALIFVLSQDNEDDEDESSEAESDQYTSSSSSTGIVTASESEEKLKNDESDTKSKTESDLYDQHTTSSAGIVTVSAEKDDESDTKSKNEPDLYDQHTFSSAGIVTVSAEKVKDEEGDDEMKKQIVPVLKTEVVKGTYRRTKSETGEKIRPEKEYRRTESAKVKSIDRLNSEEFRLTIEEYIKKTKETIIQENDVVESQGLELLGYDSC